MKRNSASVPWLGCGLAVLAMASNAPAKTRGLVPAGEIVAAAVRYSPLLEGARLQVIAAQARERQARAVNLPRLDLGARAGHYEGLEDGPFGPQTVIPAIEDRYGSGAELNQPLYTGGRLQAQQQAAAAQLRAAQAVHTGYSADVTLQALAAYWSWSKAFYAADALRASVAWMEAHHADMQNLRRAGLATENDELATAVQLDQTRLRLADAERLDQSARAVIARLTGTELAASAVPERAAFIMAQAHPPDEAESRSVALAHRAELRARREEVTAAGRQRETEQAGFHPQLSLNAHYEWARPNLLTIPPRDEWEDDAYVGGKVSWNVWDWGLTRARVAEASAQEAQAGQRLQEQQDQILYELRQARIDLEHAVQRGAVARQTAHSAELNLKTATGLWENGMARHADVLDAQARLTEARSEIIAADADAALGRAAFDHALGLLQAGEHR